MKITKAQQQSLLRKFKQSNTGLNSYLVFRRSIVPEFCGRAIMVKWCGMWLGIEPDGYCHS